MTDIMPAVLPDSRSSCNGRAGRRNGRTVSSASTGVSMGSDLDDGSSSQFGGTQDASTSTPATQRSHSAQTDSPVRASPKYEAFVMTGDKILSLNPKISPSYAKVHRNQLPPTVEVDDSTPRRRDPFDDVPSVHSASRIPVKSRRFADRPQMPESCSDHHLERGRAGADAESASNGSAKPDEQEPTAAHNGGMCESGSVNFSTNTLPDALGLRSTPHKERRPQSGVLHDIESASESPRRLGRPGDASQELSLGAEAERTVPNSAYRSTTSMPRSNMEVHGGSGSLSGSRMGINVGAEAFQRFVRRLFDLNGYTRTDVAHYFVLANDVSTKVVDEFMSYFNFAGLRIDAALRDFLDHVCLTGETSDRTRILTFFAERYHVCNPTLFESADAIHALSCALLLLNTDLHSDVTSKKMTSREFINNLGHTGFPFERALLKTLYNAVKATPFQHNEQQTPKKRPNRVNSMAQKRIAQVQDAVDYCHGWVMKKEVYDRDGKRTPFGRRKWQMYFATVRGLVLFLHKNERGFEGSQFAAFNNCIRLHHAFAERCTDYKKKQHVLRLVTAKLGEYLIQTSSPEEVQRWVGAINFVAASLSTPALPEPVSNQATAFERRPLPEAISALSVHEQLRRHREKLEEMDQLLSKLHETAPSMKTRGKAVYEYFYRERYLYGEKKRYTAYVDILQEKCAALSMTGSEPSAKKHSAAQPAQPARQQQQREQHAHSVAEERPSRQASTRSSTARERRVQSNGAAFGSVPPGAADTTTERAESAPRQQQQSTNSPLSALAQAFAVANGKPLNLPEMQRSDAAKRQQARGGAEPALCDLRDVYRDLGGEANLQLSSDDSDEDEQDAPDPEDRLPPRLMKL